MFPGLNYPLKKLDLMPIPEFHGFSAMENWGLITFNPNRLLYEEKLMTVEWISFVHTTVVHEIVHQWFGNLVTMDWWNDAWLNEGFAEYYGYMIANRMDPSFGYMDIFIIQNRNLFMIKDSDVLSPDP